MIRIFITLVSFIAANALNELINMLFALTISARFGMKCVRILFFGLVFTKNENKWSCKIGIPSPIIHTYLTADPRSGLTKQQQHRKSLEYALIRLAVHTVIAVVVVYFMRGSIMDGLHERKGLFGFAASLFTLFLCYNVIANLILIVKNQRSFSKNQDLTGYLKSLSRRMNSGEAIKDLDMLPLCDTKYTDLKPDEKLLYNSFYALYLLDSERTEDLTALAREMTLCCGKTEFANYNALAYYFLIYYYSRFEIDPLAAGQLLQKCSNTIFIDKGVAAKRVLAYYAFGIELDFAKSRALLNDAFAVIEEHSSGGEQELERKLLWELDGFLKEKGY